jgi:TolB-like protein
MFAPLILMAGAPGLAHAREVPIAVFPIQDLGISRNGVNLDLTGELIEQLSEMGNEVIGMDTLMAFMAMNRVRSVGYLDTVNMSRLRRDLGAAFILFGTLNESKPRPEPRYGLTLSLVRTSDMRTVWAYTGGRSQSDERNALGIAEPDTVAALKQLLLTEMAGKWPWAIINEEQRVGALELDSVVLRPRDVRPGSEVFCRVRLESTWGNGRPPRVFFKADEQIYPATAQADGLTYEGSWVAGDSNGRVPVTLVLDWPVFNRTESALLGNYLVDGTFPLFEVDLLGGRQLGGRLVFNEQVKIIPRMIVRKPLARWQLSFYFEDQERALGSMEGEGNLPDGFVWQGMRGFENPGDGVYRIQLEVWDKAGNPYQVTKEAEMLRDPTEIELALTQSAEKMVAALQYEGKVPLRYWRLEMWTEEGTILTQAEGEELPVSIDVELPRDMADQAVKGIVFTKDVLGKESRRDLSHFLPKLTAPGEQEEEEKDGISENWVDEF